MVSFKLPLVLKFFNQEEKTMAAPLNSVSNLHVNCTRSWESFSPDNDKVEGHSTYWKLPEENKNLYPNNGRLELETHMSSVLSKESSVVSQRIHCSVDIITSFAPCVNKRMEFAFELNPITNHTFTPLTAKESQNATKDPLLLILNRMLKPGPSEEESKASAGNLPSKIDSDIQELAVLLEWSTRRFFSSKYNPPLNTNDSCSKVKYIK